MALSCLAVRIGQLNGLSSTCVLVMHNTRSLVCWDCVVYVQMLPVLQAWPACVTLATLASWTPVYSVWCQTHCWSSSLWSSLRVPKTKRTRSLVCITLRINIHVMCLLLKCQEFVLHLFLCEVSAEGFNCHWPVVSDIVASIVSCLQHFPFEMFVLGLNLTWSVWHDGCNA